MMNHKKNSCGIVYIWTIVMILSVLSVLFIPTLSWADDSLYLYDAAGNVGNVFEDEFTFGSYPQHADGSSAPIEWVVLERYDDGGVLAISKYALMASGPSCISNQNKLPASSFDSEECKPYRYRVRLVDGDEVEKYSLSTCKPTEYAKNNVNVNSEGYCNWWVGYSDDDDWCNKEYFYRVVWNDGSCSLWAPGSLGESSTQHVGYRPAIEIHPVETITTKLTLWNQYDSENDTWYDEVKELYAAYGSYIWDDRSYNDFRSIEMKIEITNESEEIVRQDDFVCTINAPKGFSFSNAELKQSMEIRCKQQGIGIGETYRENITLLQGSTNVVIVRRRSFSAHDMIAPPNKAA